MGISIHKCTWSIVDRLARYRHVIGIHHPVYKAQLHPLRDQVRLVFSDCIEKRHIRICLFTRVRIITRYHMISQFLYRRHIILSCEILKRANTHEAGRDAGNDSTG